VVRSEEMMVQLNNVNRIYRT